MDKDSSYGCDMCFCCFHTKESKFCVTELPRLSAETLVCPEANRHLAAMNQQNLQMRSTRKYHLNAMYLYMIERMNVYECMIYYDMTCEGVIVRVRAIAIVDDYVACDSCSVFDCPLQGLDHPESKKERKQGQFQ